MKNKRTISNSFCSMSGVWRRCSRLLVFASAMMALGACGKREANFSLLQTGQTFQQAEARINSKIDILWVVDNSLSMDPLQQNLIANFEMFINNFTTKDFDYRMAVTTNDSYLHGSLYWNDPSLARVRDGADGVFSGFPFITPFIPNIVQNFMINATQGVNGSGDERAFQSMLDTLASPLNADFRREEAYFSVVILSDEDDFTDYSRPEYSWLSGGVADHSYTNPGLMSIDEVMERLDALTGSTPERRRYNVNAIAVLDDACRKKKGMNSAALVGVRYMELVNRTGGVLGSVCDSSYANSLKFIQERIVQLATEFPLSGDPNPETIKVYVNGQLWPKSTVNGWSYDADRNVIRFHGSMEDLPPAGATIQVYFDPKGLL